jgi:UDP-N-acetylglucosamine acyltransferase
MIHPTAIVSPKAKFGANIEIGPFTIIGDDVTIGDNCTVGPRCHIESAIIGANNYFGDGAMIGLAPQDLKYNNEKSYVRIGDNNIFREYVNVHRATHEGEYTVIGNDCFIMVMAHIAHDCVVGNKVILVNNIGMSGHCVVEDGAFISGYSLMHQFTRVGSYAILGGGTKISKDIPPYVMANGENAVVHGLNKVGLKRNGFSSETIKLLEEVYSIFFREKLLFKDALSKIETLLPQTDEVKHFLEFVRSSKRGIER